MATSNVLSMVFTSESELCILRDVLQLRVDLWRLLTDWELHGIAVFFKSSELVCKNAIDKVNQEPGP